MLRRNLFPVANTQSLYCSTAFLNAGAGTQSQAMVGRIAKETESSSANVTGGTVEVILDEKSR